MFHSALNLYQSLNYIPYYPGYSYVCLPCKQRFQTEKNFNRHNNSRKHIRQLEIIRENHARYLASTNKNTELDLLPSEVIEKLIDDLISQVDRKDDFFNEIQLVEDNELDVMINTTLAQKTELIQCDTQKTSIFQEPKRFKLTGIPPTYPCLTCFQLLDSQQNFNEHMLRAHFNVSIGVERKF